MKKRLVEVAVLVIVLITLLLLFNSWNRVAAQNLPEEVYVTYNPGRDMYRIHLSEDGSPIATFKKKRFFLKDVSLNSGDIVVTFGEYSDFGRGIE